jgi:transposase
VARKAIAVKKYVVTLSDDERDQLNAMIRKGKHPARQQLKARILLKADASDAGEGWSDSQIAAALATSVDTVARTRQRLVEEGLDGALTRHHSPNSARRRIFDGEAEAKLIALTRSPPPKGRARWTLVLLEDAVVERNIVTRASDNTIGRTLKKRCQTPSEPAVRHSPGSQRGVRGEHGRCAGGVSSATRSGLSRGVPG